MQVGRWGNSLAIRLPALIVEKLGLREGDEVNVEIADGETLRVVRGRSREEALASLAVLARPAPPGFKFNRDEANERYREEVDEG